MSGTIERSGKMCVLTYVGGDTITTATGWQTIGTIPNGYRPTKRIDCDGWQWNNHVDIQFLTNGEINAFLAAGTNQRIVVKTVPYICG